MISLPSVWAIVIRHVRMWKRDLNLLLFGLYWPVLDVIIWGYLGLWIQQSHITSFHSYETVILLGVLLWQVVSRGCNTMCMIFCEELWSNNVVNLFSLPLKITEWMCGVVLTYIIMATISTAVSIFAILILYDLSIWHLFSTFIIFLPPLFFSTIWLGFTCLQIIIMLGKRGVELGYVMAWCFMPFSGAYYPIEVLPYWGQMISNCLPMSYVFTGMRKYLIDQQDPMPYLIKGYTLSIIYATCAIILFIYCFNYSKQKGLARLTD